MTDQIRDLDDVEAQAWATTYAAFADRSNSPEVAAEEADECVRMLRERRAHASRTHTGTSSWDTSAHGRSAERAAVVAWLTNESHDCLPSERCEAIALLEAARAIERGEHDREPR